MDGLFLLSAEVLYELPNPGEYVAGNIVRVRIEDVIKKDGKIKIGDTVSIFAPGLCHVYAALPHFENQRYLLFLHPLKANENGFAGTVVIKPGADPTTQRPFDPNTLTL